MFGTSSARFVLDDEGQPVEEPDLMTWALWMERGNRIVRQDHLGRVMISTVFLGIDHRFGRSRSGPPVLWESMVFSGKHDGAQERYASAQAALEGHWLLVEMVRMDLGWWDRWRRPVWMREITDRVGRWIAARRFAWHHRRFMSERRRRASSR